MIQIMVIVSMNVLRLKIVNLNPIYDVKYGITILGLAKEWFHKQDCYSMPP
jgi:hypothetical protein